MLRDVKEAGTQAGFSFHKGCATFRLSLPQFQGILQIKKGHVNLSCLTTFFIEYHDNLELSCYKHFMWWVKYQGKGKK